MVSDVQKDNPWTTGGFSEQRKQKKPMNQRQASHRAVRCMFGDHTTMKWHYSRYIYTWYASCVFVTRTMGGGSGAFQVPAKHCVQL